MGDEKRSQATKWIQFSSWVLLEVLQKPGPLYLDLCLSLCAVYPTLWFPHNMYPCVRPTWLSLFLCWLLCSYICPKRARQRKRVGAPLLGKPFLLYLVGRQNLFARTTLAPGSHHPRTTLPQAHSCMHIASVTSASLPPLFPLPLRLYLSPPPPSRSVMVRMEGQHWPHFLTHQPTCGRMHSWQGGGVISTMITKVSTTTKTMTTTAVNEVNNEDTNGKNNDDLIFWHNNQPVVGCIPGREREWFQQWWWRRQKRLQRRGVFLTTMTQGQANLLFWHDNQPMVGCIPGRKRGWFDDNDNGNNNHTDDHGGHAGAIRCEWSPNGDIQWLRVKPWSCSIGRCAPNCNGASAWSLKLPANLVYYFSLSTKNKSNTVTIFKLIYCFKQNPATALLRSPSGGLPVC